MVFDVNSSHLFSLLLVCLAAASLVATACPEPACPESAEGVDATGEPVFAQTVAAGTTQVTITDLYGVQPDQFNMVHPGALLRADAIRLNIQPRPDATVGILELLVE